ncbi:peptidoglycan-binding protein [Inconstantimicrobium mannanitabidum]|uniref:Uncharacterized protein n=1 Tax=Inconstantimicrobium mannanitabidum TaxID=1604901 RepID=A0ACB5RHF2_9CLOT|nr:peptidoglycan-binding protein [Clostridium sp. TW13]GKX68536.1 hypothetical protein rsdtw13_37940 [Clostridium sp. TW13]
METSTIFTLTNEISNFINVAKQELATGFTEHNGDNMTKYGAWYGLNGQPWCAMFVSWCANQAGILGTVVPKYAYCPYGVNAYENWGRYRRRTSGYEPEQGDVIFFQQDGVACHTGIVIQYNSSSKIVTTIEGNSRDAIRSNTYNLTDSYILGYGIWSGSNTNPSPSPTPDPNPVTLLRLGSQGEAVRNLQTILISKGYNCGASGADGDFGQATYNAVIRFQADHGLEQDGIVGPKTWNALNNTTAGGTPVLRKGSTGADVVKLQKALIARGYSCGASGADGDFGQGTYNAVIKFQADHGLDQDGIVGPQTWNALSNTSGDGSTLLRKGDRGDGVVALQKALIAKGYSCGTSGADGIFGDGTYNAVIRFQANNGLDQDGIVGPATWRALNN